MITTVLSCVLVRRKRQVYINHYNCFIVFHYYQFADSDMKTNEAIQVNEAYGAQDNSYTTVLDTNTSV